MAGQSAMATGGHAVSAAAETESVGIQSIEVGASLLRVLADSPGPITLTALAAAASMPTSKAHKYLASFIRCGLVRQSGPAGRYGIGPLAVELGFAALRSIDVVEVAQETLNELRDELGTVVSMAVWANRGATIVRRAEHRQAVSLMVHLGAVMPLLASAGGRVFAAFLDRTSTAGLIRKPSTILRPGGPASATSRTQMQYSTRCDSSALRQSPAPSIRASRQSARLCSTTRTASSPRSRWSKSRASSI